MKIQNIEQYNEAVERIRENDPSLTDLELDPLFDGVDINILIDALKRNTSITNLTIRNLRINDEKAINLAQSLSGNRIAKLDLFANEIGNAGIIAIAKFLEKNKSIIELNLGCNRILTKDITPIAKALNKSKIKKLNLSGDIGGFHKMLPQKAINSIIELLDNTSISELDLHNNEIKTDEIVSLASSLKNNISLSRINLSNCLIGGDQMNSLMDSLRTNKKLAELSLSANFFGIKEIDSIAELLKSNKSLTKIGLICRGYDDNRSPDAQTAPILIAALEQNKIITKLLIDESAMGPDLKLKYHDIIKRNEIFLVHSVKDLLDGKPLSPDQHATIKAHFSHDDIEENLSLLPEKDKKDFLEFKKESKAVFINLTSIHKGRTGDAAGIIFEHIDEIEAHNFSQSVVNKFFRGKVLAITQETMKSFICIMEKPSKLVEKIKLPNNLVIISNSMNAGAKLSDINARLNIINSSPRALEFTEEHPKKLGYLITLKTEDLNKIVELLDQPKINEFLKRNPQEINLLTSIADDPEKLTRAVMAMERFPNLKSVKSLINITEKLFFSTIKAPGPNKKPSRDQILEKEQIRRQQAKKEEISR